jgi:hypothetical protein
MIYKVSVSKGESLAKDSTAQNWHKTAQKLARCSTKVRAIFRR